MLRKFCYETGKEWDEEVPFILFAIQDAKQESLGFSLAELFFVHNVRGPLKVLQEQLKCCSCNTRRRWMCQPLCRGVEGD